MSLVATQLHPTRGTEPGRIGDRIQQKATQYANEVLSDRLESSSFTDVHRTMKASKIQHDVVSINAQRYTLYRLSYRVVNNIFIC